MDRAVDFHEIYDNAPCGYILLRPDGTIFQANSTFFRMSGLLRQNALGLNVRHLLTSAGSLYYESQIFPWLLMNGWRNEIALDLVRPDGGRLPILANMVLRRNTEGQPCEIGMILFEATERRQYERDLLRSRREAEQLAEVVLHSSDAIIGLRPDGTIKSWNKGAVDLFGYTAVEVMGKEFFALLLPEDQRAAFDGVMDTLRRGRDVVRETAGHSKGGGRIDLSIKLTPHLEAPGTMVAFSAIARDITLQKTAERALLQSEKLASVGRLASSIAHEINNPLSAVINLLYLLDLEVSTPELKALVQSAQDELARVSQITTHTLRFHRQSSKPTKVDVTQLLEPILVLYRARFRNFSIVSQLGRSDASPLLCHEGELRQIILNLVGNAVDAMKTGGRLILRSRESTHWPSGGKGVRITVADTGTGMDRRTQHRIFEPFFTTKGIGGTGLGLWVAQDLIKRNSGSIRVRSSALPSRHGSVFVLYFPHSHEQASPS